MTSNRAADDLLVASTGQRWGRWRDYLIPAGLYLITGVYSLVFHMRVPFKDHWSILPLVGELQAGNLTAERFFRLHGSHWHSSGYVVMLINARVTAMSLWVEILVALLAAGCGFVALALIFKQLAVGETKRWQLLAVGAFFHFSLDQGLNWVWSWQVAVHLSTAGCLWAIAMLARPGLSARSVAVAAIGATIALYGFATAWSIWPIGVLLIAACPETSIKRRVSVSAIWLSLALVFVVHFRSIQNVAYTDRLLPDQASGSNLKALTDYTVSYLGAGVARQIPPLITPAVFVGVITLGAALITLGWNRSGLVDSLRTFRAPLALAAYGLGAALLTGLGRWTLGPEQALASRYITFSNYFWLAVTTLLIMVVTNSATAPVRVWSLTMLTAVLALKAYNLTGVEVTINETIAANDAACVVAMDYPSTDPAPISVIAAPNQPVDRWLAIMHSLQLNIFSPDALDSCASALSGLSSEP